jgi:predicted amino acid dehydrogenase
LGTQGRPSGTHVITGEAAQAEVQPGDCVEVEFVVDAATGKRERIWVAVESVRGETIEGILLNGPFFTDGMFIEEVSGVAVRDVLTIMRVHDCSGNRS